MKKTPLLATLALVAGLSAGCKDQPPEISFDVSPNGDLIVFSATGGAGSDLYLLSRKESKVVPFTDTADRREAHPVFSPDGKWVTFSARGRSEKASHLWSRSIDGSQEIQLTSDPSASDDFPSYSPDGRKLSFARG